MNNNIGCKRFAETTFPVVNISVIRIGINKFENETKFVIEFFSIVIMSAKFAIIRVTIKMYWT